MILRDCVYAVDYTFVSFLSIWLQGAFSGTVYRPLGRGANIEPYFEGPQLLRAIYNYGDISFYKMQEIFDNISISVTDMVRQNGAVNFSSPAIGIAYQEKTCIVVQWPWLARPAALVILTLVFLALMMYETRSREGQSEIWKLSPLALLYYGLWQENGAVSLQSARKGKGRERMEAFAEATTVRLVSAHGHLTRLEIDCINDTTKHI